MKNKKEKTEPINVGVNLKYFLIDVQTSVRNNTKMFVSTPNILMSYLLENPKFVKDFNKYLLENTEQKDLNTNIT
jgi:hypothetical protein